MNVSPDPSPRASIAKIHQDCARGPVGDVDPLRINVHIDDHSDAPLEYWQERLKRRRRKRVPAEEPPEQPVTPERPPPEGSIDEYATPP